MIKLDEVWSRALFRSWSALSVALRCESIFRTFLKVLEWTGDGIVWLPVTGILMACPARICMVDETWQSAHRTLFFGIIVDIVFVGLAKMLIQRPRPMYNHDDMFHVSRFVKSVDGHSFPSGHTARAAMFAALPTFSGPMRETLLSFQRGEGLLVGLWVWVSVLGLSRILLGRHHLIDVFAGVLFGVLEACVACSAVDFLEIE